MSRLVLKIVEYPKEEIIDEEELTEDGKQTIIREAEDLITRLRE